MAQYTLISELDFKSRFLYADLECLFRRTFEIELFDNLEVIKDLLQKECEPVILFR